MPTYKQLNTRHVCYHEGTLKLVRALYTGGRDLRAEYPAIFPQEQQETAERYRARLGQIRYVNRLAPVIDLLTASVVQSPPTVEGVEDEKIEALDRDADRAGTSLAAFGRLLLTDLCLSGCGYAWVDLPVVSPDAVPRDRAEEDRLGVGNPYLRRISPLSVINWRDDGAGSMEWAVIFDERVEQPSPVTEPVRILRWQVVSASGIDVYEWRAENGRSAPTAEEDIPLKKQIPGRGYMPIASYRMDDGLWLGARMEDAAVALLVAENDRRWYLHNTAVCVLTVTRAWKPDDTPTVGAGFYLPLSRDKDGADTAEFIAPPSGSAAPLKEAETDAERSLYRVVHQLSLAADPTASSQQQSGESKRMDQSAGDKVLTAFADALRNLLRETFRIVARTIGKPIDKVEIGGLDELATNDAGAFLANAALATEAKRSPTFVSLLAREEARMLLGPAATQEVLDAIEDEVEAAVGAEGTVADLAADADRNDDEEAPEEDADAGA